MHEEAKPRQSVEREGAPLAATMDRDHLEVIVWFFPSEALPRRVFALCLQVGGQYIPDGAVPEGMPPAGVEARGNGGGGTGKHCDKLGNLMHRSLCRPRVLGRVADSQGLICWALQCSHLGTLYVDRQ